LLVTQLVQTSLLLEQTLALLQEVLASLPILAIPFDALLLFPLPVTLLTPVVVIAPVLPTLVAFARTLNLFLTLLLKAIVAFA